MSTSRAPTRPRFGYVNVFLNLESTESRPVQRPLKLKTDLFISNLSKKGKRELLDFLIAYDFLIADQWWGEWTFFGR